MNNALCNIEKLFSEFEKYKTEGDEIDRLLEIKHKKKVVNILQPKKKCCKKFTAQKKCCKILQHKNCCKYFTKVM